MKELQINCPKGYQIDQDKSDLTKGIVYFKEVGESYDDVAKRLFKGQTWYYINSNGEITNIFGIAGRNFPNNSLTREQLESFLELNKLCNVAKYLNGDWLPDWGDIREWKYSVYYDYKSNTLDVDRTDSCSYSEIYFKSKELANQAIAILGEDSIRKALTLNH
jgi:hypothetical protein